MDQDEVACHAIGERRINYLNQIRCILDQMDDTPCTNKCSGGSRPFLEYPGYINRKNPDFGKPPHLPVSHHQQPSARCNVPASCGGGPHDLGHPLTSSCGRHKEAPCPALRGVDVVKKNPDFGKPPHLPVSHHQQPSARCNVPASCGAGPHDLGHPLTSSCGRHKEAPCPALRGVDVVKCEHSAPHHGGHHDGGHQHPPAAQRSYGGSGARPRCDSFELVGGEFFTGCDCTRHNGLQDQCRRRECIENPACLTEPEPSCIPSRMIPANKDRPLYQKYNEEFRNRLSSTEMGKLC